MTLWGAEAARSRVEDETENWARFEHLKLERVVPEVAEEEPCFRLRVELDPAVRGEQLENIETARKLSEKKTIR